METPDRLPPHDQEAEQAVLGCILLDPLACLGTCIESLSQGPQTFYDLRHQTIYSTMLELFDDQEPVDIIAIKNRLAAWGRGVDDCGGIAYLSKLPDLPPSAANLSNYLEIIQQKAVARNLIRVCTALVGDAFGANGDTFDLLDRAEREILAIRPKGSNKGRDIKELVQTALIRIEDIFNRKGALEGIGTGFLDLDRMTGGLKNGELTIIAAFPGIGKTSFAMNVAENALLQLKKKVGVFSLEMSAELLVTRFLCSNARVNMRNVADGLLLERDMQRLTSSAVRIGNAAIYFEDDGDISIFQLRAKARRMKQEQGIELVIVDYLQLLSAVGGPRKMENRQQEVADISRGLKGLSRELNVPVIAMSQLNDDGKLRESRAIGQDADNVWILEPQKQGEDESPDDVADAQPTNLVINKARNGPRGTVNLLFLKQYTRFESASKISDEDVSTSRQTEFNGAPDP